MGKTIDEIIFESLVNLQKMQRKLYQEGARKKDFEDEDGDALLDGEGNIIEIAEELQEEDERFYPYK